MACCTAMGVYNQRKAETVNRLVGTMREATNLCNGYAAWLCVCVGVCRRNSKDKKVVKGQHTDPLTSTPESNHCQLLWENLLNQHNDHVET